VIWARAAVADALTIRTRSLSLHYPEVIEEHRKALAEAQKILLIDAFRVYRTLADLLDNLDELGILL
jgi:hypothetical protein